MQKQTKTHNFIVLDIVDLTFLSFFNNELNLLNFSFSLNIKKSDVLVSYVSEYGLNCSLTSQALMTGYHVKQLQ